MQGCEEAGEQLLETIDLTWTQGQGGETGAALGLSCQEEAEGCLKAACDFLKGSSKQDGANLSVVPDVPC